MYRNVSTFWTSVASIKLEGDLKYFAHRVVTSKLQARARGSMANERTAERTYANVRA